MRSAAECVCIMQNLGLCPGAAIASSLGAFAAQPCLPGLADRVPVHRKRGAIAARTCTISAVRLALAQHFPVAVGSHHHLSVVRTVYVDCRACCCFGPCEYRALHLTELLARVHSCASLEVFCMCIGRATPVCQFAGLCHGGKRERHGCTQRCRLLPRVG